MRDPHIHTCFPEKCDPQEDSDNNYPCKQEGKVPGAPDTRYNQPASSICYKQKTGQRINHTARNNNGTCQCHPALDYALARPGIRLILPAQEDVLSEFRVELAGSLKKTQHNNEKYKHPPFQVFD